jgi:hypothetical protein
MPPLLAELFLPLLWSWPNSNSLVIREGEDANRTVERSPESCRHYFTHGTNAMHDQIKLIAARELAGWTSFPFCIFVWFPVLHATDAATEPKT